MEPSINPAQSSLNPVYHLPRYYLDTLHAWVSIFTVYLLCKYLLCLLHCTHMACSSRPRYMTDKKDAGHLLQAGTHVCDIRGSFIWLPIHIKVYFACRVFLCFGPGPPCPVLSALAR